MSKKEYLSSHTCLDIQLRNGKFSLEVKDAFLYI